MVKAPETQEVYSLHNEMSRLLIWHAETQRCGTDGIWNSRMSPDKLPLLWGSRSDLLCAFKTLGGDMVSV
jgi:hypothetical protein